MVNLSHEFGIYHCIVSAVELHYVVVVEVAKSAVTSKSNHDLGKLIDMFPRPFEYIRDLGSLLQHRRYSLPSDVFFRLNIVLLQLWNSPSSL